MAYIFDVRWPSLSTGDQMNKIEEVAATLPHLKRSKSIALPTGLDLVPHTAKISNWWDFSTNWLSSSNGWLDALETGLLLPMKFVGRFLIWELIASTLIFYLLYCLHFSVAQSPKTERRKHHNKPGNYLTIRHLVTQKRQLCWPCYPSLQGYKTSRFSGLRCLVMGGVSEGPKKITMVLGIAWLYQSKWSRPLVGLIWISRFFCLPDS